MNDIEKEDFFEMVNQIKKSRKAKINIADQNYPIFFRSQRSESLSAIMSKTQVIYIAPCGFGKGFGFDFRIYRTRKMVLKTIDAHLISISEDEFFKLLMEMILSYFSASPEFAMLIDARRFKQLSAPKNPLKMLVSGQV